MKRFEKWIRTKDGLNLTWVYDPKAIPDISNLSDGGGGGSLRLCPSAFANDLASRGHGGLSLVNLSAQRSLNDTNQTIPVQQVEQLSLSPGTEKDN